MPAFRRELSAVLFMYSCDVGFPSLFPGEETEAQRGLTPAPLQGLADSSYRVPYRQNQPSSKIRQM